MATLLVLLKPEARASFHSDAVSRLARLGITRLALFHDDRSTGWSLRAGRSIRSDRLNRWLKLSRTVCRTHERCSLSWR